MVQGKRLPEEIEEAIYILLDNGFTNRKTAKALEISSAVVANYRKVRDLGLDSTTDLADYRAKKAGYESSSKYKGHLIEDAGFTTTEYLNHLAEQRDYRNHSEYQNSLAHDGGFRNATHRAIENRKQKKLEDKL